MFMLINYITYTIINQIFKLLMLMGIFFLFKYLFCTKQMYFTSDKFSVSRIHLFKIILQQFDEKKQENYIQMNTIILQILYQQHFFQKKNVLNKMLQKQHQKQYIQQYGFLIINHFIFSQGQFQQPSKIKNQAYLQIKYIILLKMTSRLLNLSVQFVNNTQNTKIHQYRKLSTIDKVQFKQKGFGPNHLYRDKFFQMVKKNRHIFKHSYIQQSNRKEQRLDSAKFLLFYGENSLIDYQQYLKNPNAASLIANAQYTFNPAWNVKIGVHFFLYYKTIFFLGTKKHQSFIQRAVTYKDIGCFGLTQLLHGSNVKGIQTEAHYDHQTKTFIINSPSKNAMKFWIGAAGNMANMAVIWAQLWIEGKCYGVHVYVVPIRDIKTHQLLPGVLAGDCGPKIGNNAIDNGFLLFDNVRIPKENQLDRLSGVDQNGKYFTNISNQERKFGLQLNMLSGGRVFIPFQSNALCMNSLAIATRYTLSRKQFNAPKSSQQTFIFEYPLTKFRIVSLLAQNIVYLFGAQQLLYKWDINMFKLTDPKNKMIAELHAISSSLKPKSSWFSLKLISQCRQLLGGHGYSAYSRLGSFYNDCDVNCTWEGDNNVLLQQTAKYIFDNGRKLMKGKVVEAQTLEFLKENYVIQEFTTENLKSLDFLLKILKSRTTNKFQETVARFMQLKQKGKSDYDIWNSSQVYYLQDLALYYGDIFYMNANMRVIKEFKNEQNQRVLADCIRLWVWKILQSQKYGYQKGIKILQKLITEYCNILAKEVVGLLDSLAAPSQIIGSPFSDQNGLGMQKYLNLLYSGIDTFKKVEWNHLLTKER